MGKDRVIYDKFEDCADPREAMLMPSMFSPSAEDAKVRPRGGLGGHCQQVLE